MFPFSFDNAKYKVEDLAKWYTCENPGKNKIQWENCPFKLDKGDQYNEFVYFYPYIRDILFSKNSKENENFYFLKWKKEKDHQYYLQINDSTNNGDQSHGNIRMELLDVCMHLYEIGVGILIFEVENLQNENRCTLPQYLKFLNLARRIYPPFVDRDLVLPGVFKNNETIASIKDDECPKSVSIVTTNDKKEEIVVVKEDFKNNFIVKKQAANSSIYLSKLISYFLDVDNESNKFLYDKEDGYFPIIDDRMSVHAYLQYRF